MTPQPTQIAIFIGVAIAALVILYYADGWVAPNRRALFRIISASALAAGFFYGVQRIIPDFVIAVDVIKGGIALIAAAGVFYEIHREGTGRPIAERWKKFFAITLGVAAVMAYFNGLRNGYDKAYHRHELYHYYLGAKFFPEMGYDGLYRCTVVAQDELGVYTHIDEDTGRSFKIDMGKEVRHPDRKVRNLGKDNLLLPAKHFLENPEECKKHFSPEKWEAFKKDIGFFRAVSGQDYFNKMQGDHGFNPPPVWTVAGKIFADLAPASTRFMQTLALLDMIYLGLMFWALAWAFGWRVSAVAAIFWGCQSPAPMLWTCGAFLRQDWLFWLVFSVCLIRKKYPALGAAAFVYSALLRIFPGLLVVGWLGVVGWQLWRFKRLTKEQWRMLLGGTLAAGVLISTSVYMCGKDSYPSFYEHTLKVHDQTPLTNHMGLRVMIAQKTPVEIGFLGIGNTATSGRMKYTEDKNLRDPFDTWKRMRNERYAKYKYVGYAFSALALAFMVYVLRRVKNMWVALCAAQVFVILLSQLTCYYYSYMILSAPMTRIKTLRRPLEIVLFGFCLVSQVTFRSFRFNDDKYWMLTLICLLLNFGTLAALAPRSLWHKLEEKMPFLKKLIPIHNYN
ncbi:MAG: hypothetical protein IPK82_03220 [Polyangiaceae bacterium]|nr:hypothetical protein [Polyangiaceae bacterium]